VHKLKIALKEVDEMEYWLFLCNECEVYPKANLLLLKLHEILKIITKRIHTTKIIFNKSNQLAHSLIGILAHYKRNERSKKCRIRFGENF